MREGEALLARATDPTERDVLETELQASIALQDHVLEEVAPVIEARRVELRDQMFEALRAADGDPSADWMLRRRRWHSPALKSRLISRLGASGYRKTFPAW